MRSTPGSENESSIYNEQFNSAHRRLRYNNWVDRESEREEGVSWLI